MKNNFQIIMVVVFVALLILGVLIFAGVIGPDASGGSNKLSGRAVMWGTLPQRDIADVISKHYIGKDYSIVYEQKPESSYRESLLEAFSSGTGPDIFLVTEQDVFSFESKIVPFNYQEFNQRDYKSVFITEGDLFTSPNGFSAVPFLIDPLVMYWNRGIFDSVGISNPPSNWDEVAEITPRLTKKTDSGTISQSSVALGFMDNVTHKKDILSLFMFQENNPITSRGQEGLRPVFQNNSLLEPNKSVAEVAIQKLIKYNDPLSSFYTWNRGLSNDKVRFTTSQLAMYLGKASELFEIQSKNPNLNFDVAFVPQVDSKNRVTYGKMYGLAISKFTSNINLSRQVVFDLISADFQTKISSALSLPPVRRDLLNKRPENPYAGVFFDSALASRGWLDPNQQKTTQIFKDMFDAIFSNSLTPYSAVSRAVSDFSVLGF